MYHNPARDLSSWSGPCGPGPYPASAALLPTLLPGMFPAVSPPFEAWPKALLLSSLVSLPEPFCAAGHWF